ncbi:flavin monoamine oxidase family protein [Robertkochia aurantiaca]|uniref:flavin monoamine oxidase family protein n=1 Tax=Robertkochia aurantiaca TaxID=2873700 RepID=UPI001CC92A80|nr:FAD-dependent oxidoreductase [Robertkochia sp. 3YJGBD-33]
MKTDVIIIGAGLSGLTLSYRLKKRGISSLLLEGRDLPGGRIRTLLSEGEPPVEMGATWFGEQHQHLKALIDDLNLSYFPQYMKGKAFYQSSSMVPAQAIDLPPQQSSYRISGGSISFIDRLLKEAGPVYYNKRVDRIEVNSEGVTSHAGEEGYDAERVAVCLPPQLAVNKIQVDGVVNRELEAVMRSTHTWMQESVKVAVTFKRPFWREKGWSGTLFSNTGPVTELYDHSDVNGEHFALCGFMQPAFRNLPVSEREKIVIAQLRSVFGDEVSKYMNYYDTAWARESMTATEPLPDLFPHQHNGHVLYDQWWVKDRIILGGSETSPVFGGYMEGAVYAAGRLAQQLS